MSFASVSHHFAELQTSTSSTLKGKKSISVIPLALTWKSDHTNMGKNPSSLFISLLDQVFYINLLSAQHESGDQGKEKKEIEMRQRKKQG